MSLLERYMLKAKKGARALFLLTLFLAALSISAVSLDRLKAHVAWLADPAREGRHAGSPGAAAAAEYISQQLKELGCDVQVQDFGGRRRNVVGKIAKPTGTFSWAPTMMDRVRACLRLATMLQVWLS